MKIYVASKFEEGPFVKKVMESLESAGHTITHDWTGESSAGKEGDELKQYLLKCATWDLEGVMSCDLLLLLNHPHGKGMFTEMGIALALRKPVIIVKPEVANNIFFHLPECRSVATVGDAIELIQKMNKEVS